MTEKQKSLIPPGWRVRERHETIQKGDKFIYLSGVINICEIAVGEVVENEFYKDVIVITQDNKQKITQAQKDAIPISWRIKDSEEIIELGDRFIDELGNSDCYSFSIGKTVKDSLWFGTNITITQTKEKTMQNYKKFKVGQTVNCTYNKCTGIGKITGYVEGSIATRNNLYSFKLDGSDGRVPDGVLCESYFEELRKEIKLNDQYTAEIKERIVKIGCSEFSFEKIYELAAACREVENNS